MQSGYLAQCKACVLLKQKEYAARNREKVLKKGRAYYQSTKEKTRERNLKKYFGITTEQYDKILAEQNGGCAVCGKTPEQEGRNLAVDHNHATKEIRGILCTFCNHFIVNKHKEGRLLRAAADYLDKPGTGLFAPLTRKKKRGRKHG